MLRHALRPSAQSSCWTRFRTRGSRGGQLEDGDGIAVGIRHLEVAAGSDRDILLAIHLVRDGRSVDASAQVVAPDALAGFRVEGIEPTVAFAHEDQVSGR